MLTREERRHKQMLEDADKFLNKTKNQSKNNEEDPRDKADEPGINIEKHVIRHHEDNDDPQHPKDPEWIRAVVLLQRLIKGRNEQNKM